MKPNLFLGGRRTSPNMRSTFLTNIFFTKKNTVELYTSHLLYRSTHTIGFSSANNGSAWLFIFKPCRCRCREIWILYDEKWMSAQFNEENEKTVFPLHRKKRQYPYKELLLLESKRLFLFQFASASEFCLAHLFMKKCVSHAKLHLFVAWKPTYVNWIHLAFMYVRQSGVKSLFIKSTS